MPDEVKVGDYNRPPSTLASLPAASTVASGTRSFITDGNTSLILGLGLTAVGGGANAVPIYSDGSAWKIG